MASTKTLSVRSFLGNTDLTVVIDETVTLDTLRNNLDNIIVGTQYESDYDVKLESTQGTKQWSLLLKTLELTTVDDWHDTTTKILQDNDTLGSINVYNNVNLFCSATNVLLEYNEEFSD